MPTPPRESNDRTRAAAAAASPIDPDDGARLPRAAAIVPARLASVRLPRKMLLEAAGRPLFVHTARNAARSTSLAEVIVATDSEEILAAAEAHGISALATSPSHQSGTDRVFEALQLLAESGGQDLDVVVNVQGDEPTLSPAHIDALVAAFIDPKVEIATLCAPLWDPDELGNPSVVKVVLDAAGDALYFSRSPIPSGTHARATDANASPSPCSSAEEPPALRHVGLYAFRPRALARFCALPQGRLERRENLEQLRWLEAGGKLRCLTVDSAAPGIDTRAQWEAFRSAVEGSADSSPSPSPPFTPGHTP